MTQIASSTPSYDANGNVTNDFLHTYAWDANGKPVTVDGVGITYDALGRMVEQNRAGSYTQMVYSPAGFLMQTMNGQAAQYNFTPNPGGATVWSPAGTYYRHADWLGSSRLASFTNRTILYDGAYAPFGEQYANSGTQDLSFTGMDQDTSSNLYDFPAREYGIQGRWPSPDPAGLDAVDPSNPQSWNRYAYVENNPLGATDPTGLSSDCPYCTNGGVSINVSGFFDLFEDFFEWLFGGSPTPEAAPAPPGGYGTGIDPYGTWSEKLPKGVQVFPSTIPGLNSPSDSNCDWCGTDFRNGGHPPNPQLFPGLWYPGFVIRVLVTEFMDQTNRSAQVYGEEQRIEVKNVPLQIHIDACIAKNMLPVKPKVAASMATDFALSKILKALGLAGVEEAGPIATAGTAVGVAVGCFKSTDAGGH
jgi:RHS repeat-associated protein